MVLSATHKSFFLWILRFRPKDLPKLLGYMSQDVQTQLQDLVQKVQSLGESQLTEFALKELKKFERSFHRTYLPDVHNDWILEKLKQESPHAISAILRYLPADRVKQILNLLPNDILAQLPKMNESYAIAEPLAENIKNRFEGYFSHDRIYDQSVPFDFNTVMHLKPTVLKNLFLELGYFEIAMGLKLLPSKTQDLVLGKLLPKDRLVVERAMLDLKNTSEARHKKAQVHIISQDVGSIDTFVQEIGFLIFAKSVLIDTIKDVDVICHKLSYSEGTSLKKHVDVQLKQNSSATVVAYREELLHVCRRILHVTEKSKGR